MNYLECHMILKFVYLYYLQVRLLNKLSDKKVIQNISGVIIKIIIPSQAEIFWLYNKCHVSPPFRSQDLLPLAAVCTFRFAPIAMATPSPIDIKSAARKLPIKRKSPHNSFLSRTLTLLLFQSPIPLPVLPLTTVWSESDEIRFLQGLLGCWSQGLLFPRDLNIFYDRFSESMSQPYTRSQLSEKLRQLRKKALPSFSARSRSSHLSTRLWDPVHASTSPFYAPDVASAGSSGNKRRRPIPSAPALKASASSSPQLAATEFTPYIPQKQPHVVESNALPEGTDAAISHEEESKEDPILPPAGSSAEMKVGPKNPAVNWILDRCDLGGGCLLNICMFSWEYSWSFLLTLCIFYFSLSINTRHLFNVNA
ncbi:hypothetical protein HPP92_013270 [Vanilla planifolia]|uniref:Glabrous enhancer-binding protein-like DBD domain-containing protein n=1 Tax=Vanilla planifolia TaxID=51239 RepID=A0A835QUL2_VANPL|nr:hypothetical protein HPP92_013270 [Vanilla planifolia]